ncbi:MAG: efflux RND transporter periplasmic adaptor subunit [Steroidobacteraceae bacterium]|nr:efflux RND transporter periplasmic adaptor subunit [Nevskiaceae bacterium]
MRVASIVVTLVGLAACSREAPPSDASPSAAPPFAVLEVQPELIPVERRLDGTIEAVNQSTVSAQTAGRVAAIEFDINDFVPAGAVLLRLRSTEQRAGLAQAQAALTEATARETEAQTRYRRIADMQARQVVPKAMLDEATANRDAAIARLQAARAAVASAREGLDYTEVRAPYAGVVTQRHVQVGESVAPGTPLVSGLSLQYLRVAVDVPQRVVEQVRRTAQAAVYVGERRVPAERLTIFPVATPQSNTFRARVDLPENAADLYPGMFVKVGFVVGQAQRLMVPASAVVRRSEVTGVYVWTADGRTALRQVRLGQLTEGRYEIAAGLVAGDQVALEPLAAMIHLAGEGSDRVAQAGGAEHGS